MISGQKLLLIEDDAIFGQALTRFLGVYNEVRKLTTVRALDALLADAHATWFPDLTLLDKSLEDGTTIDRIPALRKQFPEAAILVLTGDTDFHAVGKCLALGADDYLVKSESFVEDLLIRIPVALKTRQVLRTARGALDHPDLRLPTAAVDLSPEAFERFLGAAEREYLAAAISLLQGDLAAVGRALGLARSTVFKKVHELKIQRRTIVEGATLDV